MDFGHHYPSQKPVQNASKWVSSFQIVVWLPSTQKSQKHYIRATQRIEQRINSLYHEDNAGQRAFQDLGFLSSSWFYYLYTAAEVANKNSLIEIKIYRTQTYHLIAWSSWGMEYSPLPRLLIRFWLYECKKAHFPSSVIIWIKSRRCDKISKLPISWYSLISWDAIDFTNLK